MAVASLFVPAMMKIEDKRDVDLVVSEQAV
jgi:hypothetical protein